MPDRLPQVCYQLLDDCRTPLGRRTLARRLVHKAWPVLRVVATAHRSTFGRRPRVVAVVGSSGTTTTSAAVAAALGHEPPSRGNAWGRLAWASLQVRPWQHHAVLEVGIDGKGQMIQFARMVQPDIVVVTAIGSDHNRSLRSLDETAYEKSQILCGLRAGGLVLLNGDDHRVKAMAAAADARVVTFGLNEGNDVRATRVAVDWPHGTRLTVEAHGKVQELQVRLLGRPMAYPILAALAVAQAEGRSLAEAAAALEELAPLPRRLQPVRLSNGAWLLRDESKSSIETMDAALDVLAEVPGRRIVVLGEITDPVGSKGPHYRRIGARLAAVASRVVVMGEKTSFQSYATGAVHAGLPREALIHIGESVRDAAAAVLADLGPGDVVLVKGRSTQRLDRVALLLHGRTVGCALPYCNVVGVRCDSCAMLERGWQRSAGHLRERRA